ncbi:hypothetical protein H6B15_03280 [Gemmiger formicilis]|nr:hypothetical protein [Gemmiger formicilis]
MEISACISIFGFCRYDTAPQKGGEKGTQKKNPDRFLWETSPDDGSFTGFEGGVKNRILKNIPSTQGIIKKI